MSLRDRDLSYRNRVAPGDVVTLNRDVAGVVWDKTTSDWKVLERPVAPAGAEVTVTNESNGGFNGIWFSFEWDGRRCWYNITTAAIRSEVTP